MCVTNVWVRVFVSERVFARYRARKVPTCSQQQNVSQEETGAGGGGHFPTVWRENSETV